jgi:hypothetical protein
MHMIDIAIVVAYIQLDFKNERERAALLNYSNSYAYAGRVYCICVVVFGCEDCEDFHRFLVKRPR